MEELGADGFLWIWGFTSFCSIVSSSGAPAWYVTMVGDLISRLGSRMKRRIRITRAMTRSAITTEVMTEFLFWA